eukprot:scaffold12182_cov69-Skeletonema_dohrnii-CCMP3373.AAC.2
MIRSTLLLVVAAAISGADAFAPVGMATRVNTQLFMVRRMVRRILRATTDLQKLDLQKADEARRFNACVFFGSTNLNCDVLAREGRCQSHRRVSKTIVVTTLPSWIEHL